MAKAKNMVIAGDYQYKTVTTARTGLAIKLGFRDKVLITKDTVEAYEVIDEEKRTSATSAIGRGAVGAALLGPVGLLAGASAKKKGVYLVAIRFKDGKESLLELNDLLYKTLVRTLF